MWLAQLFEAKIELKGNIASRPCFSFPPSLSRPHLFTLYIPAGAKVTEHLLGYRGCLDPLWIQEGFDQLGLLCRGGFLDLLTKALQQSTYMAACAHDMMHLYKNASY